MKTVDLLDAWKGSVSCKREQRGKQVIPVGIKNNVKYWIKGNVSALVPQWWILIKSKNRLSSVCSICITKIMLPILHVGNVHTNVLFLIALNALHIAVFSYSI